MSVRRSLLILTILVLALPAITFAFRSRQLRGSTTIDRLQFYTVQRGDVSLAVTAIGALEADTDVRLSFTSAGRVAEVRVQPGDGVLAGDVLARLVDDNERLAYDQAALSLQLAQMQKQVLLEPPREADVRAAEASVASAQGAYTAIANGVSPEDIRAAELRLQQAQAVEEDARKARVEADGGRADQYYQLLDAQIGAAAFNVEIARLQLDALRQPNNADQLAVAGARIVQARAELERLKAGPTQAELDRADIAIQQAQVQLDQAALALQRKTLVAPFGGVVAAVNMEVGALVAPGAPVLQLVDAAPLHLVVQVDEIDIRQIREGMAAQIEFDALPGVVFPAALEQIAVVGSSADGIISYDVSMTLNEPDARARVGMTAEASIVTEQRRGVLLVPNLYVRLDRRDDRAYVNVFQPDGTFAETAVQLGLRGQDMSEVVSGLDAGDVLVIDPNGAGFNLFGG